MLILYIMEETSLKQKLTIHYIVINHYSVRVGEGEFIILLKFTLSARIKSFKNSEKKYTFKSQLIHKT